MRLEVDLEAAGFEGTPEQFREIIANVKAEMFPGWTDEDIIHRPDDGKRFCNVVRIRARTQALHDCVITRAMTNARKQGL